jgi:tetratricopeptide (TPR) repeat protein
MHLLAILTFYGMAVLVIAGGLLALFQIGRVGLMQVSHWLRRMPAPPQVSSDDYKKMADVAGIPTSPSDLLLSATPIGHVKTLGSGLALLSRDPNLNFFGVVIGGLIGRLWYMMALLLLALGGVLRLEGIHYYWPQWLAGLGVTFYFYIIGGYFVAYLIGRTIGSEQRSFNGARFAFELAVARRGYWFDNRNDVNHYHEYVKSLQGALKVLDCSLNKIGNAPTSEHDRWQAMTIQYYRSLVLATLSRYDDALKALEAARRLTELLKGSPLWDADVDEEHVTESQLLFLEGELLATHADQEGARALFEQSRSIDLKLEDHPGVKLNEERLAAISATSLSSHRAPTTRAHCGPATRRRAAARIAATAPETCDPAAPGSRGSASSSHTAVVNADRSAPRPQGEPAQPALHVNAGRPMPTALTARRTPPMWRAAKRAATDQLVKALDERIMVFIGSSDAAAVLDKVALRNVKDLSWILARPAADEPQADLRALCVVAWMHWCRSQALPLGLDRDDFQASLRYFSQILPVMPDGVPSFVRQYLAQASTPTGQVTDQEISINREYERSRRLCRLDARRYSA